jgi:hypothetical protein
MLSGLAFERAGEAGHAADFRFSRGALREDEIFDSGRATPGRYIGEIGRRLLARFPAAEWLAIANPLLPLRAALLANWLGAAPSQAEVATDPGGFPVFYLLPRRIWSDSERFLMLLSVQDCALDAELLSLLLGEPVTRRELPLERLGPPPARGMNGWLNGDGRLVGLKLQAERAVKTIRSRSDWRDLPFAIFEPMHAGDVLFMAMASSLVAKTPFTKHIVCSSYQDIPEACGSPLETLPLRLPWITRHGSASAEEIQKIASPFLSPDGSVAEGLYFAKALARLGPAAEENFIVFARILRLYYMPAFHLVDQARFALGESLADFSDTLHAKPNPAEGRCAAPVAPLKILFHLNGGWTLKTYPLKKMRRLIHTLKEIGIEVSVIDRPDLVADGAVSVVSESSAALRALIEKYHIFVGVDSFPHHFSRLRMGWPTLGLFGNTQPSTSDAAYGADYQTTDRSLSCNRCGAHHHCPLNGDTECANYMAPEQVAADIIGMAQRIYGYSA